MADVVSLHIAGVRFLVQGPGGVTLEGLAPCYQTFLSPCGDPACLDSVKIELDLDPSLGLPDARRVFDGQSWQLYAQDGWRCLAGIGDDPARPRWLTEFALPLEQVTIKCGPPLLSHAAGRVSLANPVTYPLDQLLLVYALAGKGLLLHAAAARIGNKGYLFAGSSGAGKSTLAKSLAAAGSADLLSDDRVVVRLAGGRLVAFGTPWPGDAGIAENRSMPVDGLLFIHHSRRNAIRPCSTDEALSQLLPVASIHWYEPDLIPAELAFVGRLVAGVPFFHLDSRPGPEVVRLLEDSDLPFPAVPRVAEQDSPQESVE